MTAAAAFAGPAAALAVGNAGRKVAAVMLGVLAFLAIVANWTNTLGAIAQRGAGTEAASAKAKADAASDRKELERLTTAISALQFTPTDADAVAAARSAVNAAERSRKAECGEGNAKQRGDKCRAREADEATARTALATAATNKAMTDQAAKLDTQAAAIRARLGKGTGHAYAQCARRSARGLPVHIRGVSRHRTGSPDIGDSRAGHRRRACNA